MIDKPRPTVLAWWIWAATVALVICAPLFLIGCAPVPYCERYKAMLGQDQNDQPVLVMTMAEVEKLGNALKGLNAGTCKLDMGGI